MKLLLVTTLVLPMLASAAADSQFGQTKSTEANACWTKSKTPVTRNQRQSAVCLMWTADSSGDGLATHPIGQSTANQSAAVNEALRKLFGSAVEAETVFKPFYLTGDFSGDGALDIVVVVRLKGRRSTLPKDVTVLNPFEYLYGKTTFPADPTATPKLALALIHGTTSGWQTPQPAGKFLVFGESPVLILNFARTTAGPEAVEALMSLIKTGRQQGSLPPRVKIARKGDVIVLGTEAVDSFLYWNGKTYRWEEDTGGD